MDFQWSTKVHNFVNNKSLVAICWQGLFTYSAYQEEPQIEL